MARRILVTGAAGYIGSHVVEKILIAVKDQTLAEETEVFLLDNFSTGHREFVDSLIKLSEKFNLKRLQLFEVDLLNEAVLESAVLKIKPELVIHLAARISVAESVSNPALYYQNNVEGSENLLRAMKRSGTKKIIFSSTAAVYASGRNEPLSEDAPLCPLSPYGETKLEMERRIERAHQEWGLNYVIFRFFNACGASDSLAFGEWHEPETHLIPLLIRAALNQSEVSIYGNDYPTLDGTCVRDYIHVSDIANAHILGIQYLNQSNRSQILNLGTKMGTSVNQVVNAVKKTLGIEIKTKLMPRREGDSPLLVADASLAQKVLGFNPQHSTIEEIVRSVTSFERHFFGGR